MGIKLKDMEWDSNGTKAWRFYCPACASWHAAIDGRWDFNGNYESPTFSPSLLVTWTWGEQQEKKVCHFFVYNGKIQYLSDCTHDMAGQTVEIPDYEEV